MTDNPRGTFHLKVISVLMALLLWLFINNENIIFNKREVSGVKLNTSNLASRLTASYDDEVKVTIAGAPKTAADIFAYIDLDGRGAGEYDLPVVVKPMTGTKVLSVKPERVHVLVTEIKELAFRIQPHIEKQPPQGYSLSGIQVMPDNAIVRGSQESLEKVAALAVTLDLSQVTGTSAKAVRVTPLDASGHQIISGLTVIPREVKAYVVVEKEQNFAEAVVTPNIIGSIPEGYETGNITVVPQVIKILGMPDKTPEIKSISTNPIDITGKQTNYETNVDLSPPEGIAVFPQSVTVVIEIKPVSKESTP
ncbi:MAG: YbbR-like domain-containing protein [Candidatus Saccharibacteria bacterium]